MAKGKREQKYIHKLRLKGDVQVSTVHSMRTITCVHPNMELACVCMACVYTVIRLYIIMCAYVRSYTCVCVYMCVCVYIFSACAM